MTLLLILNSDQTPAGSIGARILKGQPGTVGVRFTDDGLPVDPDGEEATLTVTRDDGTVLLSEVATSREDVGLFVYTLSGVITETLDWLHLEWTGVVQGYEQTISAIVEIVGGFHFSLAAARADEDLDDPDVYSAEQLHEARMYAEQEIEQACGVAFVPRYARERRRYGSLLMLKPYLRAIRSLSRGATTYPTTSVTWDELGSLHLNGAVPCATTGATDLQVAYEHGMDRPPLAVSRAALMVAKDYLVNGPMDDRAIQRITEDGPIFIATPGFQGKRFGIPSVDAVVASYGLPTLVG